MIMNVKLNLIFSDLLPLTTSKYDFFENIALGSITLILSSEG